MLGLCSKSNAAIAVVGGSGRSFDELEALPSLSVDTKHRQAELHSQLSLQMRPSLAPRETATINLECLSLSSNLASRN